MTAPNTTNQPTAQLQQRRTALAEAQRRRIAIAQLRGKLSDMTTGDSRQHLAVTLLDYDDSLDKYVLIGGARVERLLRSCHGLGRTRAQRLLRQAAIADSRRLRELTTRQRVALANALMKLPACSTRASQP